MRKLLIIAGAVVVAGVAVAGVLYVTFPVQMTTYGGMGLCSSARACAASPLPAHSEVTLLPSMA